MSLFDLSGKVAIVTGSSRGIGRAVAEELVANGAKVVISSRRQDACDAVVVDLEQRYGTGCAIAVAASLSSRDALQHLVDETRSRLGRIDILVCNAASNPYYGPMAGISDEQFRKVLDNNILSNHWLIHMVTPAMIDQGEGSIVIVSSIGALLGSGSIGAYNISKAADLQLARNLAIEFGANGVRINCVAPGVVRTDFARALWEDAQKEAALKRATPMERIGETSDIAGVVAFLASPASRFMTGQNIVVDGGITIASTAF